MTEIFTHEVDLPPGVYGAVTPCFNGYKIFVDKKLNRDNRHKAYMQALECICNNYFAKHDVQQITWEAHNNEVSFN